MSDLYERVKKILLNDKARMPNLIESVLKNDMCGVLCEYGEIDNGSAELNIDTDSSGDYVVSFKAKLTRIKPPKTSQN